MSRAVIDYPCGITLEVVSVQERRAELEAVIERGMETFIEVGQALKAIRDEKLYAPEYQTFKEYVEDRWQFSDSRARQIIAASKVAIESVTSGNAPPKTEREARAIIRARNEAARPETVEAVEVTEEDENGDELPVEIEVIEPSGLPRLRKIEPERRVSGTEALRSAVAKLNEVTQDLVVARNRFPYGIHPDNDEARDLLVKLTGQRDYLTETLRTLRPK